MQGGGAVTWSGLIPLCQDIQTSNRALKSPSFPAKSVSSLGYAMHYILQLSLIFINMLFRDLHNAYQHKQHATKSIYLRYLCHRISSNFR